MKALGRNIRYYRKRKGWKQRQLAEIIDVTDASAMWKTRTCAPVWTRRWR